MVMSVLLGMVGLLFLLGIYGMVRDSWPASYAEPSSRAGELGRFSLSWFVLFRTVPIVLVLVPLVVTADRLGTKPWLVTVTTMSSFFGVQGWNLVRHIRGSAHALKHYVVACMNLLLGVVAAVVAFVWRDVFAALIPMPAQLLEALWTAAIASVGFWGLSRAMPAAQGTGQTMKRARRDIGRAIWDYAGVRAESEGVEAAKIRAVLLAESVQRPRWFRTIERLIQRVRAPFGVEGTTGVAQIRAVEPLTDEDSVDRLITSMKEFELSQRSQCEMDPRESFAAFLTLHNPDDVFIESAMGFYDDLEDSQ